MKRYSMVLGLALVLMTGHALAADYDFTANDYAPTAGSQVTVELKIDDWPGKGVTRTRINRTWIFSDYQDFNS